MGLIVNAVGASLKDPPIGGMRAGLWPVPEHPDRIVLHIAGADRPGVTARLTEIIAEENAELVNIGQSVLHGYLMLSAIVDMPPHFERAPQDPVRRADLGLRLEVSPVPHGRRTPSSRRRPRSP